MPDEFSDAWDRVQDTMRRAFSDHNVDPQEVEDREDLESLLEAAAGGWHPEAWREEYVVAEGEHDTARLYGQALQEFGHRSPRPAATEFALYAEDDRHVIRHDRIEAAESMAERIRAAAAALGATVHPIVRSRRVVTIASPWHTEAEASR